MEQDLVDQLASVRWKLQRIEAIEAGVLLEMENRSALELVQPYERITRVQSRLRREMFHMYNELNKIVAERAKAETAKKAEKGEKEDPDDDESKWASAEELVRYSKEDVKNEKPPKYATLEYADPQPGMKKVIARIYKGQAVDDWPENDKPETAVCRGKIEKIEP
jgi:hypothetical protein